MAKAYALDLRRKVFGAWQNGAGSQAEIARRFEVSVSFVRDLSRRFRESGGVAAKARGGGRAPRVDVAACRVIRKLVAAHHDHTLNEHRQSLAEAGHPLSRSVLGRTLLPLGLTPEKKTLGDDERSTERVKALRQAFAEQIVGGARRGPGFRGRERGQPGDDAPPRSESTG